MTSVWWVRRDIRLADNGALASAAAHGPVVPLFVWEDNLLAGAGDHRRAFLFEALNSLDNSVGRALIYRNGPAVHAVPEFCLSWVPTPSTSPRTSPRGAAPVMRRWKRRLPQRVCVSSGPTPRT